MNVVVGAVLSRHQVYLNFAGADARAVVNGAAMLNGKQLADTTFLADHAATGGVSRELFKTVVDGEATGVFQGKIIVQQAAQQTDGKMMSACLILSDEGQMMNKPELEIFADDVACGHGATCGALDEDLLFYLMQRGLPKAQAGEPGWSRPSWEPPSSRSATRARERLWSEPSRRGSRRAADRIPTGPFPSHRGEGLRAPDTQQVLAMNAPVPNTPYDVEAIRAEFPILAQKVYGRPLVYLDNAASSQKPRAVIDAMVNCMETGYANVHRGLHFMANAATEGFEGARETTRQFLNADSTDEIIFTRNATEAYNLVASSMGLLGQIGEGDEIILSIMEHHSNIVPWHFLRERRGAVIKWAPVDDEGNFLVEEYEKLFTPRTRMVAITQMSNVLGTVTPAAEIVRIAHAHGVPVLLDGAQRRGPPAHRREGARLRLLRLHRSQGLRTHRYRRALRQEGMAGAPAPLSGWRRDDPHGEPGRDHL